VNSQKGKSQGKFETDKKVSECAGASKNESKRPPRPVRDSGSQMVIENVVSGMFVVESFRVCVLTRGIGV
jgi:hypothetical protein